VTSVIRGFGEMVQVPEEVVPEGLIRKQLTLETCLEELVGKIAWCSWFNNGKNFRLYCLSK
jgi:hypothetical protein